MHGYGNWSYKMAIKVPTLTERISLERGKYSGISKNPDSGCWHEKEMHSYKGRPSLPGTVRERVGRLQQKWVLKEWAPQRTVGEGRQHIQREGSMCCEVWERSSTGAWGLRWEAEGGSPSAFTGPRSPNWEMELRSFMRNCHTPEPSKHHLLFPNDQHSRECPRTDVDWAATCA